MAAKCITVEITMVSTDDDRSGILEKPGMGDRIHLHVGDASETVP